ncbi:MAG: DUF4349 domain-containing protein [Terracidiphilus sp.]
MNLTTHPVAPEEIMAWLDGELSNAEAHSVAAHVNDCAECGNLAAQFRATTQALSSWTVPLVPTQLENSVATLAERKSSGQRIPKQRLFVRSSFWTWKQWTLGVGLAAIVILAVAFPTIGSYSYRERVATKRREMAFLNHPIASQAIDGQANTDQESKVFKDQSEPLNGKAPDSLQTLITPGIAADSNGLFHGLGDHSQNSFRADGHPPSAPAPMIARTASLTILVKDIVVARSTLDSIVAQHRGYSAQITFDLSDSAPPRGIVASLRVPAPDLPSALADLRAIGRVEKEKQSGEEVTQQHTDLVARLQNSRETEQRLRDILAQRTGKIEDVLQVEEEIARVRGEIESMEVDQKTLEHRVDFATIDLELVEDYKAQFNSPAPSAATRMHNAFVAGFHHAADALLGIVLFFEEYGPVILIWLMILGLPSLFVWRRYRKVRSRF